MLNKVSAIYQHGFRYCKYMRDCINELFCMANDISTSIFLRRIPIVNGSSVNVGEFQKINSSN